MANFLYSGAGDVRLAEVLAAEYQLILADRFSILMDPLMSRAAFYAGNARGKGSTALKTPLVGLSGYNRMGAVAENASTTPTSVADSSATVTIGRQAIERGISDINDLVDSIGLNVEALIRDGLMAYAMRWMEMLCALLPGFSSVVGSTTIDMTADDFFSAQFTLIQNVVPGPYLCVLYPVQATDFLNSIRAEGGPWKEREDVQTILGASGNGLIGMVNNIPIVSSQMVPTMTAGADSGGAMFGARAVQWASGTPAPVRGAGEVIYQAGTVLYTELERDASATLTKIVHNAHIGFSELEDLRGVTIRTDR